MKMCHAKCDSGVSHDSFESCGLRIEKLKAPRSIHGESKHKTAADVILSHDRYF
jgi:hypothetical protein